ncbi:MAG: 30S ribosome-binding factor RbfA [Bacteroidetes bacterium]|jgi:ribosome-binding factor A|nr:30S ribosome-binding factor RbfA [Bacteroidota bacterium]
MSIRTERVAKLVQREIADMLNKDFGQQQQPLITVTDARVTADLSIAYVYVSVYGDTKEQREATFKHLEDQVPQLRSELATRIRHQLRQVPELKLFLDESQQRVQRMENLFDRIREERKRRGADESGEELS